MTTVGWSGPVDGVRTRSAGVALSAAVIVGLGVGVLTAYGQGWLSDAANSLANSAGPWSLAAFLVARSGPRIVTAVPAAMLTLVCCEIGYAIATEVRGGANSAATVAFWLTAAVLAGPPLGIAAAWSNGRDVRREIGFGVIGGVMIGEGIYGWTTVADTTDWRYWAVELAIGVAIILVAVLGGGRRPLATLAGIGAAAATAAVVFAAGRLA